YTWSRPPHGLIQGEGVDGVFSANENLLDDYTAHTNGEVFLNRFIPELRVLDTSIDAAAIFPSAAVALQARADGTPIDVVNVPASELHGGVEATDRQSFGEDEAITLDFTFETYVKVKSVTVTFFAGVGWQIPFFKLGIIDPAFRGIGAADPTIRTVRYIGESTVVGNGTNVPFANLLDTDALVGGLPEGIGAKFTVTITPAYSNMSFWNQFGMEFHLDFGSRDGTNSMGIASIELEVEAMVADAGMQEEIFVPERRYYISTGSASGDVNPEEVLEEADSATAYWRQTEVGTKRGANKFRAYAFGDKIEDNQPPLRGDPKVLEQMQVIEYDKARDLLTPPYTYDFITFTPLDEAAAIAFYRGTLPTGPLTMSIDVSPIADILKQGRNDRLYGQIPTDRNVWHAPGHAWTFKFVENYTFCCNPCPKAMVIDYNYAHLHDGLAVVETARFWDELPSGFTRLIRSTEMSPDPTFGQSQESGIGITGGTSGQAILINAEDLIDSQGNFIDTSISSGGGLGVDEDGNPIYLPQGGE
ncbi:MAG: hypothetical protein L0Y56_04325, partial [Nitrospira sp.]|nr:hypothetical protein [Nitrospira sp.]